MFGNQLFSLNIFTKSLLICHDTEKKTLPLFYEQREDEMLGLLWYYWNELC